ncbi:MAG: response regulator transcription factor [Parabacteroides sp.]|nr:response regulator transcription factor [Parabacteroides sp.]
MSNNFNILFYSKDKNTGVIIQEYFKTGTSHIEIFEEETMASQRFQTGNFNICLIDYIPEDNKAQHLAIMIKSSEKAIPVIFLCDHPTRDDISFLFSLHADDIIRKPLDFDILSVRINSILNRYQPIKKEDVKVFLFGKFRFDLQKQLLSIEDKSIKLTTKEADLLTLFCRNANQLIDRAHALHLIWRNDTYFSARSMDVYITKLRKLLKDDPSIQIINVHGKGYKLQTQPEE